MRFKITWNDGRVEEVEQSDCNTVEQFISCRFGSAGVRGASVIIVGAEPKPTAKPVQKPAAKPVQKPVTKPASDGAVTREE